jgi:hypothetical protein
MKRNKILNLKIKIRAIITVTKRINILLLGERKKLYRILNKSINK